VEVGGTSTFVIHDVTKVEVRWADTHLKIKSHTPKERGRLTPRKSVGLSDARAQRRTGARPGQVGATGPTEWVCEYQQYPPTYTIGFGWF
jgi:hypothetical protein